MAFNSLLSGSSRYLLPYQIYSGYRYPFSALCIMQQGLFPTQTNDITLTANPSSPICTVCRNFTINSGVTYSQKYICVVATNSITINGSIDCSSSSYFAFSFFNGNVVNAPSGIDNDIPSGGGGYLNIGLPYGFGGGAGYNKTSLNVNPTFSRVIYGNLYSTGFIIKNSVFASGVEGGGAITKIVGGIVILCAPTININRDVLAYGRDISSTSSAVYGNGGGVIYLVGNNITIGSVNINAKGGNATTATTYDAYGGGGGFIVIAATGSIMNNATINVSGGGASGGTNNYMGQNGSLIVKTFSFYDSQL